MWKIYYIIITYLFNMHLYTLHNHNNIIIQENTMRNHGTINSSVISYTVNYTDSSTGISCGYGTVPATSCINGVCSHEFNVSASSRCPPEANFTVKVFGTNTLGDGPTSDPIKRGTS